jgi:hypothetical protein
LPRSPVSPLARFLEQRRGHHSEHDHHHSRLIDDEYRTCRQTIVEIAAGNPDFSPWSPP